MDYLYGEEGQRAMAQEGVQYGVRPDVPAPAGYPTLGELTLTTRSREERLRNDDYMKTFNETLFR
jgi:ABC-type Fe3+ transport system substrate-binding protein